MEILVSLLPTFYLCASNPLSFLMNKITLLTSQNFCLFEMSCVPRHVMVRIIAELWTWLSVGQRAGGVIGQGVLNCCLSYFRRFLYNCQIADF